MSTIPPISDPRFDPNYSEPYEPKKKRSAWATCLIGCLVTLLVLFVLGVAGVFWVTRNFRGWAADAGSHAVKQMIVQSELPEQEKADINIQVDRLATAVRENRISMEQGTQLVQNLIKSPLMTSFMVSAIDKAYFAKSGLSEDEKAAGRITLQRFARGMIDETIGGQGIEAAMKHVATKDSSGNWKIRQQLSDADLRAFLDAAKTAADDAGVAEQPPQFDPSDEFKRIIDETLAQPAGDAGRLPDDSTEPAQ